MSIHPPLGDFQIVSILKIEAIGSVEAKKQKLAKESKVTGVADKGSSHSESKTPPLKRNNMDTTASKTKERPSKVAKKDNGSASASSLGATQILVVMT